MPKKNLTPEYFAWMAAKARCNCKTNKQFKNYGGRGIKMCEEWEKSFQAFLSHIGTRPSPTLSLDRIDTNQGYQPGNVRWATATTQASNRRNNRLVTAFGETKTIASMGREHSVPKATLRQRLNRGMPAEMAATMPPSPYRPPGLQISANGKTQSRSQWEKELGLSRTAIWQRINVLGWSLDKAVTTPKRGRQG